MKRALLIAAALPLAACNNCSGGGAAPAASSSAGGQPAPAAPNEFGEVVPPGEAEAIEKTKTIIVKTVREAYTDAGPPARRDAHAKAHGCVKARFVVPDLPKDLKVGVFAEAKTYPAWIRYSNGNGTPQPDKIGDGRGMAVKLMGVPGKKLLEGETDATTQDFVMINHPVFFIDTAANYVTFQRDLAGGNTVKYFAGIRNPATWHIRGGEIAVAIFEKKPVNPLEIQYWSMAAYRFGDQVIKFSAKPCEVHKDRYQRTDSPTFLADNMEKNLKDGVGCFQFMIQRRTQPDKMPVEDPTTLWREQDAPFVEVARIEIPSQAFRSAEQQTFCENLTFTPWHALPEHRPLGGINRLRKVVYETISTLRHSINRAAVAEPVAGADFWPATNATNDGGTPASP